MNTVRKIPADTMPSDGTPSLQLDSTTGDYLGLLFHHLKIDLRKPNTYMQPYRYDTSVVHGARAIDLTTKRQAEVYKWDFWDSKPRFRYEVWTSTVLILYISTAKWLPVDATIWTP